MDSLKRMSDQPAACVVFTADNNYAHYLAVTIRSIIDNASAGRNYDLIVFDGGISPENRQTLCSMLEERPNFSLRFFDIVAFLRNVDTSVFYLNRNFVIATYFRFFIADILAEYDRCLYLDCDLVVNGDVAIPHDTELNGHMVAAVRDLGVSGLVRNNHKKLSDYVYNILGLEDPDTYFNVGVLVMNLDRMRREQVKEKLLEKLQEIKTPRHLDQSVMNAVFNGDVEYLDFTYNFMWSFGGEDRDSFPPGMRAAYDCPQIIHYTTQLKPWHCKSKRLAGFFWKYAGQTPFSEQLETEYQEFLVRNVAENRPKHLQYTWMCILTLGLNKKLKQKKNDYLVRIQAR